MPVAAAFLLLADGGAQPDAAKQAGPPPIHATPATFERVFDGARGGQTIALEAGDYGTFTGGSKASTVTLVAAAGANVKMAVDFDPADHIKIEGVTLTSLERDTHDVTIKNSTFTGPGVIRADEMSDANVVLAGNRHAGIDKCDGCYEGRLTITGDSGARSGIVVTGSTFGPGRQLGRDPERRPRRARSSATTSSDSRAARSTASTSTRSSSTAPRGR